MKDLLNLKGIVTVLNTPFSKENILDVNALTLNVSNAVKAGVVGFLVPAMASEVDKLSETERYSMVKTVRNQIKSPINLIGGASASNNESRIAYARQLLDLGCDGILVSIPYQNDLQYEKDVRSIAALNPPYLMLQDWAVGSYGIPSSLILKLFNEIDCFRAIKVEVVPAGMKYSELIAASENRLHVSGGWAVTQMIEGLDRGVHAFMPTGMHWIYTQIYDLYRSGNREGAKKLFNEILPILAFSNQHLDISIHFFKRLLWRQGIYPTPKVRDPVLPFDHIHQKIADELIDHIIRLENNLKK